MSEPFVAEIRIVGFNFAPTGWATCDGQLLPISQNTALFSLLGTTYGGDGQTTFALPNLQGSAPVHPGQGPGLANYNLGQTGGETSVTLNINQMASHDHPLNGGAQAATTNSPAGTALAEPVVNPRFSGLYAATRPTVTANPAAVFTAGGSQPHNNMQPYLTLLFIIALQGVFPARN